MARSTCWSAASREPWSATARPAGGPRNTTPPSASWARGRSRRPPSSCGAVAKSSRHASGALEPRMDGRALDDPVGHEDPADHLLTEIDGGGRLSAPAAGIPGAALEGPASRARQAGFVPASEDVEPPAIDRLEGGVDAGGGAAAPFGIDQDRADRRRLVALARTADELQGAARQCGGGLVVRTRDGSGDPPGYRRRHVAAEDGQVARLPPGPPREGPAVRSWRPAPRPPSLITGPQASSPSGTRSPGWQPLGTPGPQGAALPRPGNARARTSVIHDFFCSARAGFPGGTPVAAKALPGVCPDLTTRRTRWHWSNGDREGLRAARSATWPGRWRRHSVGSSRRSPKSEAMPGCQRWTWSTTRMRSW